MRTSNITASTLLLSAIALTGSGCTNGRSSISQYDLLNQVSPLDNRTLQRRSEADMTDRFGAPANRWTQSADASPSDDETTSAAAIFVTRHGVCTPAPSGMPVSVFPMILVMVGFFPAIVLLPATMAIDLALYPIQTIASLPERPCKDIYIYYENAPTGSRAHAFAIVDCGTAAPIGDPVTDLSALAWKPLVQGEPLKVLPSELTQNNAVPRK